MRPFCLEVRGDYACFTRPEMKVERVSYDLITPSAARSVFEAVFWKPEIRWKVTRVEVLEPVRWISVRRNEVGAVTSTRNVQKAMRDGRGDLVLYIEDERQQRAGLFLRDVAYRLTAEMVLVGDDAKRNPAKYASMFTRRASQGQCINQPYLGCREFAARFRLIELDAHGKPSGDEPAALSDWSADLGWMLYDYDYDYDYGDRNAPQPRFFRASIRQGVLDLTQAEVRG